MSTELIGQRLTQLRKELAGPEKKWTQAQLAEATGLSINMISRLENFGGGSIEILQMLLAFYYEHGYNPSWVLLPDNSRISKRVPTEAAKTVEVAAVHEELLKFSNTIRQHIDFLKEELRQY